ncbi:MAG TPA: hypothetical protein VG406_19020 [Isosphaeraceae bacterium]|jgi:hypothetical protein|nr:hypothetical protein [Isosphaeraceae bacterium]
MTRHTSAIRPPVVAGLIVLLVPSTILAAEPRPSPSRYVPAEGLIALLEYDGLDAHQAAWEATAAHGLLNETPAGALLADLATQALDRALKDLPGGKLKGADVAALHEHILHNGFAIAVRTAGDEPDTFTPMLILNGLGRADSRERFERLVRLLDDPEDGAKLPDPVRVRGRDVYQFKALGPDEDRRGPFRSYWFEGDDLIWLSGGDTPSADHAPEGGSKARRPMTHERLRATILDTIEGRLPNAVSHPGRIAALAEDRDLPGFEGNGLLVIEPGDNGRRVLKELAKSFAPPQRQVPFTDPVTIPAPFPIPCEPPGSFPQLPGTNPTDVGPDRNEPFPMPPPMLDQLVPGFVVDPGPIARAADPRLRAVPSGALRSDTPAEPEKKDEGPDLLKTFGLDGIRRVIVRWGFQGKALLTLTRIEAPSPRKGVLSLLEPRPFRKDMLPPIPVVARSFAVVAFEPGKGYEKLINLCKQFEPGAAGEIEEFERVVRATTGQRLREDLLGHLGPEWAVVSLPAPSSKDPEATAPAILAGVDDPEAFLKVLDGLADRFNAHFREPTRAGELPVAPIMALERLEAPARGYRLTSPAKLVLWLNGLEPTVQVGRSQLAVAWFPSNARAALQAESAGDQRWSPAGEVAEALRGLPDDLTFLAVGDPRDSWWPGALESLPATAQYLGTGLSSIALGESDTARPSLVMDDLGIPRPGSFRFRIDPSRTVKAADVERFLFPSVLAAVADDRGYRIISREALPLACVPFHAKLTSHLKWKGPGGPRIDNKFTFEVHK